MSEAEIKEQAQLRVGSHVLVQLGSELVTDVEQAILECVKNSYDADSPGCRIAIDTRERGSIFATGVASTLHRFSLPAENVTVDFSRPDGQPLDLENLDGDERVVRELAYTGSVSVEDTGDGLDEEQLKNTWLVISGSKKRSAGGPKTKTVKGRTPLGDKGVGRLGTMRLGDILVIETAKTPEDDLARAVFRWGDCEVAETVDQIPVDLTTIENKKGFKGTRVSVLGLRDISEWRKPNRGEAIARSLARLISPFEATSTFPVAITVDDVEHSLVTITNDVLSRAIATFDFDWAPNPESPSLLTAKARFRKSLLAGTKNVRQTLRTELAFGNDGGKAFHEALTKMGRLKGYDIKPYKENSPWFIELEQTFTWSEVIAKQEEAQEDPGPFKGVFNYFHLTELGDDTGSATTGTTVTRKLVKDMAGISILRDGFRVRSPGDWLNMASEMTSGSTYGLRVDNTLGYFALSGENNYKLTEKSDREGFVEDAPYRGFLQIARACRKFATDSMESVRRVVDQYAKNQEQLQATASGRPADPVAHLQKTIADTAAVRDLVDKHSTELHRDLAGIDMNAVDERTAKAVRLASAAMSAMDQVKEKLAPTVEQLGSLRRIRNDIDDQRDQMVSLFESAAVGLSARGLAHELRTHLTEIRQQVNAIQKASESGVSVQPMLRAIRGACSAIASSASLIDPMLPRSRSVKEEIDLESFLGEYIAGRKLSMARYGISAVVSPGASTIVRMNRSRLLQVVDNLVQNSIYWLRHTDAERQTAPHRAIEFKIMPTGFAVWDSGPGVSQKVEESLFDMFVSSKPDDGAGQGLGLFIVSQLLDIDGCSAMLSEERNSLGRRYKFVVDLSAVLIGDAVR